MRPPKDNGVVVVDEKDDGMYPCSLHTLLLWVPHFEVWLLEAMTSVRHVDHSRSNDDTQVNVTTSRLTNLMRLKITKPGRKIHGDLTRQKAMKRKRSKKSSTSTDSGRTEGERRTARETEKTQ